MATKPKDTVDEPTIPVSAEAKGTALVHWKDRMIAIKSVVQESEKPQGGFISFKGGRMSYGDELLPGDKINAIIVDYRMENALYRSKYVAGVTRSPDCWAIARPGEEQVPNRILDEDGNEQWGMDEPQGMPLGEPQGIIGVSNCEICWANEWGSAKHIGDKDPGARGKACKTSRRIMVMAADDATTPEKIARASIMTMIPPATSTDNFQTMMNQVTKALDTAHFGAVVEISVKPHPKFLFQVHFKVLQQIQNDDIMQALIGRYEKETAKTITYPKNSDREDTPPPKSGKY